VIVLDASAVLELVVGSDAGALVAETIAPSDISLHAPHLLSVEVAQAVRRLVGASQLSSDRASEALTDLAALDIYRYEHEPLLGRAFELRQNLTTYDAMYVGLAEVLDAPLVTFDARLERAPGHEAEVVVLATGR
jgi:predicted nucleic acid-binding protein